MAIFSLLRDFEYKELAKLEINGKILDLGGSKNSGYHKLIRGEHEITVANIDESYGSDLNFNIEENFPLGDESFDAVLCLNVLEHVFDYNHTLLEIYRVLKKDGKLIGAVPFLIYYHPCPNDYFRYTKEALARMFKNVNFQNIEIKELGSGLFGVLYQLKMSLYRFYFVSRIFLPLHTAIDKFFNLFMSNSPISKKYFPLGYFFYR